MCYNGRRKHRKKDARETNMPVEKRRKGLFFFLVFPLSFSFFLFSFVSVPRV